MTKNEAVTAIGRLNMDNDWRKNVIKILDDIDTGPQEFTVRELGELIDISQEVTQVGIMVGHQWRVAQCNKPEIDGDGTDALRAKLIELATPPRPTTVTMDVPIKWVETWAGWYCHNLSPSDTIARANAIAALAKLETQP